MHLSPEFFPQLDKQRLSLLRDRPSKVQEDLERCCTRLVEKLEAASCHAIHVTGLLHGERRSQLLPANVHVERIGLDVEELAHRAEASELPVRFNRRRPVGHQHPHRTKSLETLKQLFPPGNFEFHDSIRWEGPDN